MNILLVKMKQTKVKVTVCSILKPNKSQESWEPDQELPL